MNNLINAATKARDNSYSPYSEFKVGAAILMKDGIIVTGTNVENASYGGTICAERSAIVSAISQGYTVGDFKEIVIVADTKEPTVPCAMCLQVMKEFFSENTRIIMTNLHDNTLIVTLEEMLPYSFGREDLEDV